MRIRFPIPRSYEEKKASVERIFHFTFDLASPVDLLSLIFKGYIPWACSLEMGLYRVRGLGVFRIDFLREYDYPCVLKSTLGYVEMLGIKIPVPCFIYQVDSRGMSLIHFIGESYVFFLVGGRPRAGH